jgi:chorismate synthase
MKPLSTLRQPLPSVDIATGEPVDAVVQRSDVCAVPAAAIVGEAMLALVLADACLEKFGGDSLTETRRNWQGYLEQIRAFPPGRRQ